MPKHILPLILTSSLMAATTFAQPDAGYAPVNGIEMYYEIHGEGQPLVMLHGGFMSIDALGPILPTLAQSRRVIAVDLEGHGRTVDLDRPIRYEQMADDVAGLLAHLDVDRADVFGFSMGGGVALRLAVQHPARVHRLIVVSANHRAEAFHPSIRAMWPDMTADDMAGTPMEEAYLATAPQPERWPSFVDKMREFMLSWEGWPDEEIAAIAAPALLVYADADFFELEHVVDLYRLLGGAGGDSWTTGTPEARLAIIPGTTHFDVLVSPMLVTAVTSFLDAPEPQGISRGSVTMPTDREVTITRAFEAPREVVWAAWTEAERLSQWMSGVPGWEGPRAEVDLRVGGSYVFSWDGPDGEDLTIRGEYTEITPPERLVTTESWGGDWPETVNTLILTEENGQTVMALTVRYPSTEARDAALATGGFDGLNANLDNLARYLGTL